MSALKLPMSSKAALREARKRWGRGAMVTVRPIPNSLERLHSVGKLQCGCFCVAGEGQSWEAAFAAVTRDFSC